MPTLRSFSFRARVCVAVSLLLSLWGLPVRGQDGWKAGCARVKITPEEPVWMAGYASRNHPSEGVRTDLWAKALALEDASGQLGVIVTMDLLSLPRDFSITLKNRLQQCYGLDRAQVILNVSHTHSGPVVGCALQYIYPMSEADWKAVDRYTARLLDELTRLVGAALQERVPVHIRSGNGLARFATNRRNNVEKEISPTTERKGPHDHAVPVLAVEDAAGSLKAILFGYACHNTVLSTYLFDGDYAGYAQAELERLYPGTVALFFQGAGGDQNPLPRRKLSLAVQYGKELAAAVEQALSEGLTSRDASLEMRYREIPLPLDTPEPEAELMRLAEGTDYQARWARGMLLSRARGETQARTYPYPIQSWRIGTQRLFALGGELVSDYALRLKARYGADCFVMGYSNDVMSYIPSTTIWDEGGYEGALAHRVYALPARWTRDVEERILEAVQDLTPNEP